MATALLSSFAEARVQSGFAVLRREAPTPYAGDIVLPSLACVLGRRNMHSDRRLSSAPMGMYYDVGLYARREIGDKPATAERGTRSSTRRGKGTVSMNSVKDVDYIEEMTKIEFVPISNSLKVSRSHALIAYHPDNRVFEIVCLSRNGLHLDDKYLKCDSLPVPLTTGSRIRIGDENFVFALPRVPLMAKEGGMGQPVDGPPELEESEINKLAEYARLRYPGSVTPAKPIQLPRHDETTRAVAGGWQAFKCLQHHPAFKYHRKMSVGEDPGYAPGHTPADLQHLCDVLGIRESERTDASVRPTASYSEMIYICIATSETGYMSSKEVYERLREIFPYYGTLDTAKVAKAVSTNLSSRKYFDRGMSKRRKGDLWRIVHLPRGVGFLEVYGKKRAAKSGDSGKKREREESGSGKGKGAADDVTDEPKAKRQKVE